MGNGGPLRINIKYTAATAASCCVDHRARSTVARNNEQRVAEPTSSPTANNEDLAAFGRQVGIDPNEPAEAARPPTLARRLHMATALVDKLQATPGDPHILANLTPVIHRTVELQDNVSKSRDGLARTASVLSAVNHPAQDQRQGLV